MIVFLIAISFSTFLFSSECAIEIAGEAVPWTRVAIRPPAGSENVLAVAILEYGEHVIIDNVWVVKEQGQYVLPPSVSVSEPAGLALRHVLAQCYKEATLLAGGFGPLDCRIEKNGVISAARPVITEALSHRISERIIRDGSSRFLSLKFDDVLQIYNIRVIPRRDRTELTFANDSVVFSDLNQSVLTALRLAPPSHEADKALSLFSTVTYSPEKDVSSRESAVVGYVAVKLTNGITLREIAVRRHSLEDIWIEYPLIVTQRGERSHVRFLLRPSLAFRAALEPIIVDLYRQSEGQKGVGKVFQHPPSELTFDRLRYTAIAQGRGRARGMLSLTMNDVLGIDDILLGASGDIILPRSQRADGCKYPVIELHREALSQIEAAMAKMSK